MFLCWRISFSLALSFYFSVLHPRHKLQYFELAGWEEDWVETAKGIVRAKFEEFYATPADDDVVMLPPAGASTKEVRFLVGLGVSSFDLIYL